MKRTLTLITASATTVLILGLGAVRPAESGRAPVRSGAELAPELIPVPVDGRVPGVRVWTRPGEGARLHPGARVNIFFRPTSDAFVVILDIDTKGRVRKLFPRHGRDDGFVPGGVTVALPGPGARYRLQVTGPAGTERIVAYASSEPIGRHWRELAESEADLFGAAVEQETSHGWSAQAQWKLDNSGVVLASARSTRRVAPRLMEVPVCGTPIARDETWFQVVGGRRFHW
jgi:hypothetical protein